MDDESRVSPMLARWLASSTASMKRLTPSATALDPKREHRPGAAGQIPAGQLMMGRTAQASV